LFADFTPLAGDPQIRRGRGDHRRLARFNGQPVA
jgi:hypothetical protein